MDRDLGKFSDEQLCSMAASGVIPQAELTAV